MSLGTRSDRRCCLVSRPLLRQRLRPLLKPCTAATVLIQRLRPLLKPCTAATAGLVASEEGGPAQQRRNDQTGCRRKREGARSALVGHTSMASPEHHSAPAKLVERPNGGMTLRHNAQHLPAGATRSTQRWRASNSKHPAFELPASPTPAGRCCALAS